MKNIDTELLQTPQEIKCQLTREHELWLQNPMTQQALKLLQNRAEGYKNELIASVLTETDESLQTKLRVCISTAKTCHAILSDSKTFVDLSTTKQ